MVFYLKDIKSNSIIKNYSERLMADENTLPIGTCSTIHLHPFITLMSQHLLILSSKITGVPHDDTSVFVLPLIP